ncbi:MAG: sulfonate ABC transporter substrate-binding protein [Pseudomonadota bacterium]|nr:sulfonate ABC transporter substrate-binding protein [Pseudomonadota bacterium]
MTTFFDKRHGRRRTLGLLWATAIVGSLPQTAAAQHQRLLRIGFQKYGTLTLLKVRGILARRLAPLGITVSWSEFPAGPVLLEALNVGSIDYGTVGEAPPIFAQAAGADLLYVGNEPASPKSEAIVVQRDSHLRSVADLKGRKVVLNKGSNVHYLLVRALEHAGLAYTDVQTVFLPPADARAAFERGSVDAWVIWDPFLAAAEKQLGARVLVDGSGLVSNRQFFLAARGYAEKNPDVLQLIQEELAKVDQWAQQNPQQVAIALAAQTGLDASVLELAARRFTYGVQPVSPAVLTEQQRIADSFAALKLIPKPINVRAALPVQKS